jgi:hypothetical protein
MIIRIANLLSEEAGINLLEISFFCKKIKYPIYKERKTYPLKIE